jgi:ankyrin repeat protein
MGRHPSRLVILVMGITFLAMSLGRVAIRVIAMQSAAASETIPPLVEAVWRHDLERIKQLLADGADATVTANGRPAWMWAIVARDERAVDLLLAHVKTVDSPYALLIAANRNDPSLASKLLDRGGRLDARAVDRSTALMIAAASGHTDTIRLLIARGASVNLVDDYGDTALMAAVRAGSIESVKLLLAAGADLAASDEQGRTALTWALRSRRPDITNALRAQDDNGSVAKRTPAVLTARVAVERSLPLIQRGTATWNDRRRCSACHHHPLMFRATAIARRKGFPVDAQLLDAQVEKERGRAENKRIQSELVEAVGSETGVLRHSLRTGGDPSFGAPWFLSSLGEAGLRWPAFETEALFIAKMQQADGRWRHGPPRAPIMSSDFTATANAVRTLQMFASRRDAPEVDGRLERAAAWLRSNAARTLDEKAYRLFGLRWTKSDARDIANAVAQLRADQNPDGGWPQLNGLNSDAYATGLALVALHEAGDVGTADPTYQRGVEYLLETQEPDGSWLVHKRAVPINEYFESGFPHGKFQFISYAGTCWATMALVYAAAPSR